MLALLSVPILKHPLSARSLFSILLSFMGAFIIATRGDLNGWNTLNLPGVLLALGSTVVWALYWLFSARMEVDAVIKLFVGFLSGSVMAILYAFTKCQLAPEVDQYPWLAVGYVGLFEMGITFFIWLKALQLADSAAKIGNMIYLTPFLSLLLLAFILDESIHNSTLLGLIVIITGILSQRYRSSSA
jgi:drug/metabolite transporter (DMT)-like permease